MALPTRRACETVAPKLAGHRVHVTIGRMPSGEVVEVWIDLHKEGAPLRGMAHALARLASKALQAGVPIGEIAEALRGVDGGPSGEVEDYDGITHATSVADLVGQVLEQAA